MTYNIKNYEQVSVSTDAILMAYDKRTGLKIITMKRPGNEEFFANKITLIGGFTHPGNYFIDECIATLNRKIGLTLNENQLFEQRTISTPNRDPRGWIVLVPYISYLNQKQYENLDKSKVIILDCKIGLDKSIKLSYKGESLSKDDFGFDHYDILMNNIREIVKSSQWSLRFTQLIDSKFTIKEAFELFKLLNPETTMLVNNFKRKFNDVLTETTDIDIKTKRPGVKSKLYTVSQFY